MQGYAGKQELISEIRKTAAAFSKEFAEIQAADKDLRLQEGERTPYENLAYQLGWMDLIKKWEDEEMDGLKPQLPAPGIKWNQMALLHARFYQTYQKHSWQQLQDLFKQYVEDLCCWLGTLNEQDIFQPGGKKWAQSTKANWPVWKWVHINTVAPFKSFRAKIRKWKKLRNFI